MSTFLDFRSPETTDMHIKVIRTRYIEFIISLSDLEGSVYMTKNSLENYEVSTFLLEF